MLHGSTRHVLIIPLVLLAVSVLFIAGCGSKPTGRSTLTTGVGDRKVKASFDGGGFISTKDDTAVITFGPGKLVVERESVKLDGVEIVKLSADAKDIKIDYTAGKITITADGESILSKELEN
jgi:hypothetical protein